MLEKIGGASMVLGIALGASLIVWVMWVVLRVMLGKISHRNVIRPLRWMPLPAVFIFAPIVINALMPLDLGPREQTVEGEIHLTLTGWDRSDYGRVLAARSQAAVLQMANADVNDETLMLLAGMPNLRELDLNNTQVTDAGLAILAELPRLEALRLARTGITDAGFREHLLNKDSLKQLDLTGTAVASKTVREWKAKQEGRQALK